MSIDYKLALRAVDELRTAIGQKIVGAINEVMQLEPEFVQMELQEWIETQSTTKIEEPEENT